MHSCINTPGSYYCTCGSGYTLNTDKNICQGKSCTVHCATVVYLSFKDINECAVNNGDCEQLCNNSIGSYWCSCVAGYTLDTNNMNCSGTQIIITFYY